MTQVVKRALLAALGAVLIAACGNSQSHSQALVHTATGVKVRTAGTIPAYLRRRVRPIGRGIRFHPAVSGRPTGRCERAFGRRFQAHIELFGANKVVLLPAGIGTGGPRITRDATIKRARCFGNVVTLDPTGTVFVRPGTPVTVGTLFRAWGQPLTGRRIASFAGASVQVFVNGKRLTVAPADVTITRHEEVVIEIGPYVPPHVRFEYSAIPRVN